MTRIWSDALRLAMAELQLEEVTRVHPDGSVVVARLTLDARDGELLAVVGPSGSGKSTTLRLIAGLEPVTSGTITIGGRVVNGLQPHERNVAMVFEGDSLYPHLTAGGNLRFGLEMGRVPKPEIDLRVQAESRALGVARLLGRMPWSLSAGQRQRVAVGRATVRVPDVFLLDEPLTHLDAARRDRLRQELSSLQRGMGITTVYVTHDQAQAMAVGDRIAVLRRGRLEQIDTPRALYRRPDNTFVASFLGSPGMSLLPATIERDTEGTWIGVAGQRLRFPGQPAGALRRYVGRPVVIGLRPEHVTAARGPAAPGHAGPAGGEDARAARLARQRLRLTATRVEHLGPELLVTCGVDAPAVVVHDAGADPLLLSEGATLQARFPAHSAVRRGDPVDVEVEMAELTYFDPATGAALWHPL
ncbi:MAG TPA: ABC transporter ATP-binding protein [Actinomycetes bacterium]|nr:ABC transporter ATP-binding protein [Actinomycetes bacterium]